MPTGLSGITSASSCVSLRKTATNFKYLEAKHLAAAWGGMAINQEMTKGSQGEWHQDWQDCHRIFNRVVPFGKFTGADLALWQPKVRLQLSRGEAFFFF
jgi:hypothetical protein